MESEVRIGDKIRQLRELQRLSVTELAERSGSTVALIEDLEGGALVPSLSPLMKIARALGVRLGTFLDDVSQESPAIVRAGAIESVVRFTGDGRSRAPQLDLHSLGAGKRDRHMEPLLVDVHPPESDDFALSSHEGEEFIYVLGGRIELCYGKDRYTLDTGDTVYYDSIVPHHVHAADGGEARMLAVIYTPL